MSKTAVVYWSGTGNTETMAQSVLEGAKGAGAQAELFTASEFSPEKAAEFDSIAFGCPSMGAEVLEEDEFQPMWDSCKNSISGKKIAIFGSYGWGDGEWMRNWEAECRDLGLSLASEPVLANETPDDDACQNCQELGASLA